MSRNSIFNFFSLKLNSTTWTSQFEKFSSAIRSGDIRTIKFYTVQIQTESVLEDILSLFKNKHAASKIERLILYNITCNSSRCYDLIGELIGLFNNLEILDCNDNSFEDWQSYSILHRLHMCTKLTSLNIASNQIPITLAPQLIISIFNGLEELLLSRKDGDLEPFFRYILNIAHIVKIRKMPALANDPYVLPALKKVHPFYMPTNRGTQIFESAGLISGRPDRLVLKNDCICKYLFIYFYCSVAQCPATALHLSSIAIFDSILIEYMRQCSLYIPPINVHELLSTSSNSLKSQALLSKSVSNAICRMIGLEGLDSLEADCQDNSDSEKNAFNTNDPTLEAAGPASSTPAIKRRDHQHPPSPLIRVWRRHMNCFELVHLKSRVGPFLSISSLSDTSDDLLFRHSKVKRPTQSTALPVSVVPPSFGPRHAELLSMPCDPIPGESLNLYETRQVVHAALAVGSCPNLPYLNSDSQSNSSLTTFASTNASCLPYSTLHVVNAQPPIVLKNPVNEELVQMNICEPFFEDGDAFGACIKELSQNDPKFSAALSRIPLRPDLLANSAPDSANLNIPIDRTVLAFRSNAKLRFESPKDLETACELAALAGRGIIEGEWVEIFSPFVRSKSSLCVVLARACDNQVTLLDVFGSEILAAPISSCKRFALPTSLTSHPLGPRTVAGVSPSPRFLAPVPIHYLSDRMHTYSDWLCPPLSQAVSAVENAFAQARISYRKARRFMEHPRELISLEFAQWKFDYLSSVIPESKVICKTFAALCERMSSRAMNFLRTANLIPHLNESIPSTSACPGWPSLEFADYIRILSSHAVCAESWRCNAHPHILNSVFHNAHLIRLANVRVLAVRCISEDDGTTTDSNDDTTTSETLQTQEQFFIPPPPPPPVPSPFLSSPNLSSCHVSSSSCPVSSSSLRPVSSYSTHPDSLLKFLLKPFTAEEMKSMKRQNSSSDDAPLQQPLPNRPPDSNVNEVLGSLSSRECDVLTQSEVFKKAQRIVQDYFSYEGLDPVVELHPYVYEPENLRNLLRLVNQMMPKLEQAIILSAITKTELRPDGILSPELVEALFSEKDIRGGRRRRNIKRNLTCNENVSISGSHEIKRNGEDGRQENGIADENGTRLSSPSKKQLQLAAVISQKRTDNNPPQPSLSGRFGMDDLIGEFGEQKLKRIWENATPAIMSSIGATEWSKGQASQEEIQEWGVVLKVLRLFSTCGLKGLVHEGGAMFDLTSLSKEPFSANSERKAKMNFEFLEGFLNDCEVEIETDGKHFVQPESNSNNTLHDAKKRKKIS